MAPAPQEIRRGTFTCEIGSQAPKVYIRAVMFREADEILLVSDKIDGGKWTLPGGWADVGQTPFGVAAKGTREEARLLVEPRRLLALFGRIRIYHTSRTCTRRSPTVRSGELIRDTTETSVWTGYLSHSYKSSNPEALSILVCGVRRILCLRSEPDSLPGFGRMPEA